MKLSGYWGALHVNGKTPYLDAADSHLQYRQPRIVCLFLVILSVRTGHHVSTMFLCSWIMGKVRRACEELKFCGLIAQAQYHVFRAISILRYILPAYKL